MRALLVDRNLFFSSPGTDLHLPTDGHRITSLPSVVWLCRFAGGPQFIPGAVRMLLTCLELARPLITKQWFSRPMFAVTRTRRFCNQKSALKIQAAASGSVLRNGS